MIEAVIFDWGGTLSTHATAIRLDETWQGAARHLAEHAPHDASALAQHLMEVEEAFWRRTASEARAGALHELLTEALTRLDVELPAETLEEAASHYLAAWEPHIEHDPEAAPTLEALRERGIKTALLSNTHWPRSYHDRFLQRDGLHDLLDARLYTCELEYMKPHPQAFRDALDAVGVADPRRAVFVGDRPWDDIYGARRAGLRTALRPNPDVPSYDVEPDVTLGALADLVGHVDVWSTNGGADTQ